MSVTLRQLEVFLAVAETEHLGKAAEHLHLSAAATSSALAALEQALGEPLFDRVGRGLRLNGNGRRVRDLAVRVVQDVDELKEALATTRRGLVVVGASTTIATYVLGPVLASFAERYPAVSIRLRVGNTHEMVDAVASRSVDVAFVEGPVVDQAVSTVPWRQDRLVVFVSASHPLAAGRVLGRDELARTWVLRERGSGTRDTFVAGIGDDAAGLGRVLEFGSSGAVVSAVAAGGGIGCLSELVVEAGLTDGALVELAPPSAWRLARQLWRVEPVGGQVSSLGRAFLHHTDAG